MKPRRSSKNLRRVRNFWRMAEPAEVLINRIPGEEVRNSGFLLEEGAVVWCNYGTTVGFKIDSLLDDPDPLTRAISS